MYGNGLVTFSGENLTEVAINGDTSLWLILGQIDREGHNGIDAAVDPSTKRLPCFIRDRICSDMVESGGACL